LGAGRTAGRPPGFLTVADSRIDELRRRLERDPGSRLFAQLAEEYRKAGDRSEAIRVARAGLALHPAYPSARLTLGRALLDSGDAAGARAELESALHDAPDNILASRFLGQALEALGELGPALQQLERTLKMAPGDRQLEGQIVALRTRLGAPAVASPRAAPLVRPGGAGPSTAVEGAAPLPATLLIYRPGDRVARTPSVPPPAATAPPRPAPPPPPAGSAGRAAQPSAAEPPPAVPSVKAVALPSAPVAPDTRPEPETAHPEAANEAGVDAELVEGLAPTLPPGAMSVEEMIFEAEGGLEGTAAPASGAWAEAPGSADQTPFPSPTLAELYFRQGLVDRAVEVYRQVLSDEPQNERAQARLAEIVSAADGRAARRRALEQTIAGLEGLLAAIRRRGA